MAILGTVPISSAIAPTSSDNPTPSHSPRYGLGGFRGVATLQERNSIPPARREANMLVYVLATDTLYILQEDLETWTARPFGVTKRYRTGYLDGSSLVSTITGGTVPWTDTFAPYNRMVEGEMSKSYGLVEWKFAMPEEWDRSPVKVKYYVTMSGGSVSYTPYLQLNTSAACAAPGTDYTSLSWGTTVITNTSVFPAGGSIATVTTAAVTPGGTVSAGNMLFFRMERYLGSYSGTLHVVGIGIQWRELTSDISPW